MAHVLTKLVVLLCITISNSLVLGQHGTSASDHRLYGPANERITCMFFVHQLLELNSLNSMITNFLLVSYKTQNRNNETK